MTTTQDLISEVHHALYDTHRPPRLTDRIAAADRIIKAIDERDTQQWAELRRVAGLTASSHRAES